MKRFIYGAVLLILAGCSTSEKEKEIETPPVEEENVVVFDSTGVVIDSLSVPRDTPDYRVSLNCRRINGDDSDDPLYEVSVRVLDQNIPLDTVHTCRTFNREDFAEADIPGPAISGCGGWYKGTGEYFYLIEENSDLVVKYAWLKEEQTTNPYPYREVFRLQLPKLEQ